MNPRQQNRNQGHAYAYGRPPASMVSMQRRQQPSTGAIVEWEFVKANKWYFIGGGLVLAAGIAYALKQH